MSSEKFEQFNGLTPAEAERLAMLSEECAEVIQAAGKILRHGYESCNPLRDASPTNRTDLRREILDVMAVLLLMVSEHDFDEIQRYEAQEVLERKLIYSHHQGEQP